MERAHIHKNRNEREVTTDTTNTQRIIKDDHKQLYANKMDKLEEMVKFLEEMYNLRMLNQEERENMSRPTTSNEIESVIEKLSINKSPRSDGFTGKFYQTFTEELTLILKLYQNFRGRNTSKLIL